MEPIAHVAHNYDHPVEVLAQTIAGEAGWQWGPAGQIFDENGIWIANSLTAAAAVIATETEWLTPNLSGISWGVFPPVEENMENRRSEITALMQHATRRFQMKQQQ